MKKTLSLLFPALLLCTSGALGQEWREDKVVIADSDSSFMIKMTSSMSTLTSKVGDPVTGEVIDPRGLRGAFLEGRVDRADHDILAFSFQVVKMNGKSYPIRTRLISVTSSKGLEGQDDLGQRLRIEGAGYIAYGVHTELDEGAEVRMSAWKQ